MFLHRWEDFSGTTVENKGKLILNEISIQMYNSYNEHSHGQI